MTAVSPTPSVPGPASRGATGTATPDLSVVICTYNPRLDLLRRVIDSLAGQTLTKSRWELIVVDNNSSPSVREDDIDPDRSTPLRIVRQLRQGLGWARAKGIAEARAPLFVFVDDDNFLAPDYLENALRLGRDEPETGAFGCVSVGVFETPLQPWKRPLVDTLGVRNYGDSPISSREPRWGPWEPIGAGMVIRRDAAERFAERLDDLSGTLGRTGGGLLCGEDTLMARCANELGYANSYEPSLRLEHFITAPRLKSEYLRRLIEGFGRSYVILHRVLDQPLDPVPIDRLSAWLTDSYRHRVETEGRTGSVRWYWDVGYACELHGILAGGSIAGQVRRLRRDGLAEWPRDLPDALLRSGVPAFAAARFAGIRDLTNTAPPEGGASDLRRPIMGLAPASWMYADRPTPGVRELVLDVASEVDEQRVSLDVNGRRVWSAPVPRERARFIVPLHLSAGANRLELVYHTWSKPDAAGQRRAMRFHELRLREPDDPGVYAYKAENDGLRTRLKEVLASRWERWSWGLGLRLKPEWCDELLRDHGAAPGGDPAAPISDADLPRISIVIPSYNSGPTIGRAIGSIVDQGYPNLQLIVMDGGSTDDTAEVLARLSDDIGVCVSERDGGQADALNKGFRHADGDIWGWLCADDELLPGSLRRVGETFAREPETDVLIGRCERHFADGATYTTPAPSEAWRDNGYFNPVEQPSTYWRASLHRRVGEMDTSMGLAFDWDLWARFRKAGARLATTDYTMSLYYFTDDNKTSAAGRAHMHEGLTVVRRHAPLGALVAPAYRLLYAFDRRGAFDDPPTATAGVRRLCRMVAPVIKLVIGRRAFSRYNLHFASLQERGLKWW
ncbi:MAG: glycosyltransferase [Phycisphaeraceae bacterium]|nr:MAG: glycosyltransferase [Phycisphaeraceae bacterium]